MPMPIDKNMRYLITLIPLLTEMTLKMRRSFPPEGWKERRRSKEKRPEITIMGALFFEQSGRSPANLIRIGILERIERMRRSTEIGCYKPEKFSPDTAIIIGTKTDTLLVQGIMPIAETSDNPFGEAYRGNDPIEFEEARLRCQTKSLTGKKLRERINEPNGSIKLVPTPFEFGQFIEATPLEKIRELWEKDELGFQMKERQATHMSLAKFEGGEEDAGWSSDVYTLPVAKLAAHPNEQALHYGTALFEGMAVEEAKDKKVYVFRLKDHWERLNKGAKFLGLPEVPFQMFEKMVMQTVQANRAYIPPRGKGRLYLRPNYYDSGAHLRVGKSKEHILCFTAAPIGTADAYFGKSGTPKTFALATNRARAVLHGVGTAKAAGNYSATIGFMETAKKKGYPGLIFTDPSGEKIKESQASGIVYIKHGQPVQIIIPSMADGDILDSITMKSIAEIAGDLGYTVTIRDVRINELKNFNEVLTVGTAAAITPIHKLQPVEFDDANEIKAVDETKMIPYVEDGRESYGLGEVGGRLFKYLCAIKAGKVPKHSDYLTEVPLAT